MATLYARGKSWYLQWTGANGKQWRRSLGKLDRRAAEAICAAKEAELKHSVRILPGGLRLRYFVEKYYLPWIEGAHPASTAKYALAHVVKALGQYPLDQIPIAAIENFKRDRLAVVKSATVNKEVRMLKAVVRRAFETNVIGANPVAVVKPPRVISSKAISFFRTEELQRIYAVAGSYAPLWKFLANTGLRRAEMAKARRRDVVSANGHTVLVVESDDADDDGTSRRTKSAKLRTIPLNAAAIDALASLGWDRLIDLTPDGITQAWQYMRRRANESNDAPPIVGGVHKLRHTFCTHLVMGGVTLRTVQVLAGHSSIQMTERYAHLVPGAESEAVERISL